MVCSRICTSQMPFQLKNTDEKTMEMDAVCFWTLLTFVNCECSSFLNSLQEIPAQRKNRKILERSPND